ncbi:acyltransferase family protein [Sphingomonas sp. MMS12-HWE2-04]|uniref:acyltransferase family protein n=1 Tax=Sphingomonas sp. MMS12-HWE2-04 TaxID=3234199 RepID=UPI00384CA2DA
MHASSPAKDAPDATPARRTVHFGLLDGLRGVAAVAVVLMHIGEIFLLPDWLPQAYLAVPFFFVLSGFVISYAYEGGLMRTGRLRDFVRVRVERLYPLLIVGLCFGVLLLGIKAVVGGDRFSFPILIALLVAALAMVPLPGRAAFLVLPPQWSLAIELWGNVVHFALRRWISVTRLAIALPMLFVAMAVAALVFGGLGTGWNYANLAGGIATFAYCYTAGILIHHLWKQERLPRFGIAAWAIAAILVLTLVAPQPLRTPANAIRDLACAGFVYPLLLIAAIQTQPGPRWRALSDWFGRLSYPLYVTHFPVVSFCCLALLRFDPPRWALYAGIAPIAAIAILVAWLMLVGVDEPVRRWVRDSRKARLEPSAGPA